MRRGMRQRFVGPALLALAATAGACSVGLDLETPCDREAALSYDNFGRWFMNQYCAGCHSSLLPEDMRHGAPMGVDLDTYGGVLEQVEAIAEEVGGEAPSMPPGGGPSDEERALLGEWLQCAAAVDEAEGLGSEAP